MIAFSKFSIFYFFFFSRRAEAQGKKLEKKKKEDPKILSKNFPFLESFSYQ